MWHNSNIKIKLKLQLLPCLVTTMNWYEKTGYIECNKFIENSLKNHLDYINTGPRGDNISQAVELEAQISIFLASKLWWVALINKTTISSIVNEALAFSIPCLLEQHQMQEDFRLEVELKK